MRLSFNKFAVRLANTHGVPTSGAQLLGDDDTPTSHNEHKICSTTLHMNHMIDMIAFSKDTATSYTDLTNV